MANKFDKEGSQQENTSKSEQHTSTSSLNSLSSNPTI